MKNTEYRRQKGTIELLTIGDCSIDLFMKIDGDFVWDLKPETTEELCFHHGAKIPVDAFDTSIAGNACNVAVGATKLGLKTAIYTELGDDANAERIIKELNDKEIDTTCCIRNKGTPTNVHSIIVHAGDRTIFSYHEPRNYKIYNWPKPKWLFYSSLAEGFQDFQGELVAYIEKNPDMGVAFNPGTQQLRAGVGDLKNFLAVTHVLFVNKEEAQVLTDPKEEDLEQLHKNLQKLGPKITVITLGEEGSTAFDGQKLHKVPAYGENVKIADKTGAGDSYTAAFIAALHHKKPLETAMKWGAINSSHVIRKIGAVRGLLTKKQIENLE